jgi:hypothetical protein
MADIMADNQTEAVLSMLDRGEADDKTRDKVSAALLRSQTKVLDELGKIQDNLWSLDRLEALVDKRHEILCSKCVLRTSQRKEGSWLTLLLSSESLRYFVLILVLVWAVIYIKTGAEGVNAIRGAATSTVTGGAK